MSDTAAADVRIIIAAQVAPMTGAVIRDGAVAFAEGCILAVGSAHEVRNRFPGAPITDLGDALLLPGLVNAHVHLDLTHITRPDSPGSFLDWVKGVIRQSIAGLNDPARWIDAALDGVRQCHRFGVTTVGDIAGRHVAAVRAALASVAPTIRVTSFGEVTAMGPRRGLLDERIATATAETPGLRTAISPHAPYSVEPAGYRRCLDVARQLDLPLATHLAETPDEATFLATHGGTFGDLWTWMGGLDDHVPTFGGGPIRFAQFVGVLDHPTLLAHVNYCDDDELALLAVGRASVVYCPRTHAYFNHPPHRWRDMLARGINVALGTDSCASSPDLNLLDDLRLVHRLAPDVAADELWPLITTRAARALGLTDVGSLAPHHHADFVAFPIRSSDPLLEVLEGNVLPSGVWIAGNRLLPTLHPLPSTL